MTCYYGNHQSEFQYEKPQRLKVTLQVQFNGTRRWMMSVTGRKEPECQHLWMCGTFSVVVTFWRSLRSPPVGEYPPAVWVSSIFMLMLWFTCSTSSLNTGFNSEDQRNISSIHSELQVQSAACTFAPNPMMHLCRLGSTLRPDRVRAELRRRTLWLHVAERLPLLDPDDLLVCYSLLINNLLVSTTTPQTPPLFSKLHF